MPPATARLLLTSAEREREREKQRQTRLVWVPTLADTGSSGVPCLFASCLSGCWATDSQSHEPRGQEGRSAEQRGCIAHLSLSPLHSGCQERQSVGATIVALLPLLQASRLILTLTHSLSLSLCSPAFVLVVSIVHDARRRQQQVRTHELPIKRRDRSPAPAFQSRPDAQLSLPLACLLHPSRLCKSACMCQLSTVDVPAPEAREAVYACLIT